MEQVSENPNISLQEAEEHYQSSSENYKIDSGESHLAYYRDKHPSHYKILFENV
ncbi:hypothetical protein N7U66_16695 [Lacinutrix neustonica]|uniref:Uncharacterized protein n=1 Tax=Lacinutrix neustonica TaxID=2980107 RepID=A0A9E8MU57_9FLAO|nr:hypothetical protein [Lacinutrix neustonica]WAC01573.1 hypothetical protein N7U66_16695 [Lacinutrix neustonica]